MKATTRTLLLAAATLFLAAPSAAQEAVGTWSIIPRVGVNLSKSTDKSIYVPNGKDYGQADRELKTRFKPGMKVGVDVEYQATPVLAVSAGVFYSMQGCRFPDYEVYVGADENEPTTKSYTGFNDFKFDREYINVPILAHGYLAKGLSIEAGVQLGFLVGAKTKFNWEDYTVTRDGLHTYTDRATVDENAKDNYNTFCLSTPIGVSYEYEHVILNARYNLGWTTLYKHNIENNKDRTVEFTVGYRFSL